MPTLYVLVGVPGSGKSTWVANQEWAKDAVHVSTDAHVDAQAAATGQTYNDVFKDYMPTAVNLMTADVIAARKAGKDIIWDQTSTTPATRAKKIRMLPNYKKIAVVFKPPEAEELKRRLASRPGKNIPDSVMTQMLRNFSIPTKEEGFDEIWFAQ